MWFSATKLWEPPKTFSEYLVFLASECPFFSSDLLKSLEMDEDKIIYEYLPGLVTAYGGFGCIAFFYPEAPLLLHQFFVLSNCSLVSLFYLRSFPGYTAWFVLWCVALWGERSSTFIPSSKLCEANA
ncbi:hypothetical protein COOONC_08365 [Cooperia oncophora]